MEHRRLGGSGRTFVYSPLLTREKYVTQVLRDVKDNLFGSSMKKMLSFFVQSEELSEAELQEILSMIAPGDEPASDTSMNPEMKIQWCTTY